MRIQTSMETYQNNAAASFIEDGNYQEAITCLSTGIVEFSNYEDGGCEHCYYEKTGCRETAKVMSLDQCMLFNQESFKEDGKPYLYKNPIRIPNELNVICCMKCRDHLFSTVMVFNLALSYHLQALDDSTKPSDSDLCLHKAIMLYELAFDIQKREHFGSNFIFALAVMNNLAMIHRIRNDETLANEGFQRMLSILMYLVDSGKIGQCGILEGFQYNISSSTSQTTRENVAGAA